MFLARMLWSRRITAMARRILFILALAILPFSVFSPNTAAQDRPLRTVDAETVPAGTLRSEIGFDFLQDVGFPLSGLRGDETSVGIVDLRMGVGKIVEVEVEGAMQNFLDVKSRGTSFVPNLSLTGVNSTHDTGDFTLATKVRLLKKEGRRPGIAFKFGFIMPNLNAMPGRRPSF